MCRVIPPASFEQRGLAVVDVSHDGNDGGARPELVGGFLFRLHEKVFGRGGDLDVGVVLFGEQLDSLQLERLVFGRHDVHLHEFEDERGGLELEVPRELVDGHDFVHRDNRPAGAACATPQQPLRRRRRLEHLSFALFGAFSFAQTLALPSLALAEPLLDPPFLFEQKLGFVFQKRVGVVLWLGRLAPRFFCRFFGFFFWGRRGRDDDGAQLADFGLFLGRFGDLCLGGFVVGLFRRGFFFRRHLLGDGRRDFLLFFRFDFRGSDGDRRRLEGLRFRRFRE